MAWAFNSFLSWTIVFLKVDLSATFPKGESIFFNAHYSYGTTSPLGLKPELNEAIFRKQFSKQVDNTAMERV